MKKMDIHMHLSAEPVYRNGRLYVSDPESMLRHMDELEIEKAILMSMGDSPNPLGCNESNIRICRSYPDRFAWMCNLDATAPGQVYDRLAEHKAQGAVGVGELVYNRPLDDPFLQAVFQAAQKLSLPVTFHMSPEEGFNYGVVDRPGLPLLEQTLRDFPDVIFLGHSQPFWIEISGDAPKDSKGRNAWGKGQVMPRGALIRLFEGNPNLYGDLSANSAGRAIMRDEAFGIRFLETYADRLLFGTDMLNAEQTLPLADWMEDQVSLGNLSKETCRKIFIENAKTVFAL